MMMIIMMIIMMTHKHGGDSSSTSLSLSWTLSSSSSILSSSTSVDIHKHQIIQYLHNVRINLTSSCLPVHKNEGQETNEVTTPQKKKRKRKKKKKEETVEQTIVGKDAPEIFWSSFFKCFEGKLTSLEMEDLKVEGTPKGYHKSDCCTK